MRYIFCLTIYFIFLLSSCKPSPGTESNLPEPDYWPSEAWISASPESRGMNPDTLDKMITSIKKKNLAIDSLLIIRDGYLVLDYYGLSYGPEDRHIIHSCTKSIVSTLVGIALDQGLIESLDQPDWPSYQNNVSIGWGKMRISPPDLAKFGFLILHKGKWDGTQIVSEDYLAEATSVKIKAGTLQNYYGYQWWIQEEGLFMAQGYAGQFLIIYPAENLVVVFNSTLDERYSFAPRDYFNDYILKSIQ